jgi:hypothetical protein
MCSGENLEKCQVLSGCGGWHFAKRREKCQVLYRSATCHVAKTEKLSGFVRLSGTIRPPRGCRVLHCDNHERPSMI